MTERPLDMNAHGSLALTVLITATSFISGLAVEALRALDHATAGITSGQAALVVGFCGLLFQYGPRAAKWTYQRLGALSPRRSKR